MTTSSSASNSRPRPEPETINFQADADENLFDQLKDMTDGHGPHHCIDSVGMEAHGTSPGELYDWVKWACALRPTVPTCCVRPSRRAVRAATVSIPACMAASLTKSPLAPPSAKGLTFKMGQTHVQRYLPKLMEHIVKGDIDPSFLVTHVLPLADAPEAYEVFKHKKDGCMKVVLKPWETSTPGKVKKMAQENDPQSVPLGGHGTV